MDKKKVKKLIEQAVNDIISINMDHPRLTKRIQEVKNSLFEAKEELYKSDWVSVEDELPPYDKEVWVCNQNEPDEILVSHRTEEDWIDVDKNGFVIPINCYPITHWRKIEKLEV